MPSLPLTPQTLPSGVCPDSYQALLNLFASNLFVNSPANFGIQWVFGPTKPSPSDNDKGWFRTDSSGKPIGTYLFAAGAWLMRHPMQPGQSMWIFDDAPDFTTYDGGDANPLSALSGPMWEASKNKDGTLIAARFPIVAGTLPSGTVLSPGDTGGLETDTSVNPHTHPFDDGYFCEAKPRADANGIATKACPDGTASGGGTGHQGDIDHDNVIWVAPSTTGSGGTTVTSNNMPPWVCGVLISRTARLYYSVS